MLHCSGYRFSDRSGGQDGWVLAKFFFACFFSIRKKRTRPISNHLGKRDKISKQALEEQALEESSRAGHDGYSRAGKVAPSCSGRKLSHRIWFIFMHGASYIINCNTRHLK